VDVVSGLRRLYVRPVTHITRQQCILKFAFCCNTAFILWLPEKTGRKSPETRFEEVFLAELIWRLVPGVSPNYTTSEMPAKFRFQWQYSFGLSEKKQVLVSTYFFEQPEFAKRSSKTHFRASSARNWVIGLLLANTWWKYTVNVPLILTITNIDPSCSKPSRAHAEGRNDFGRRKNRDSIFYKRDFINISGYLMCWRLHVCTNLI
jgi:hypothetical protein